ncbi:bifunctional DNA primase/polymerase [Meiothermus hypogaeus]|uniref:DNA primase/polymerase bifunctional N-terminal domain-containing protein n=2 Tax=Meiothermus hypogaeus TaxID=884155 RepID=A0A511R1Y6_9DEIN|nr:bifunctional DNA primase/polymerase [Meiothermus hypogaeus]RIH77737.1 hypothetical protein Mhypo_01889 [Meiothermus hypogaeus]GEM83623.1 hypothetical protein MHY01S_17890 [Meiothermus hypogaeus NBRC 106114]GIW36635.1 MAG: hypothetical protein KatS3mg073_0780 [Meiothermus sp.]
MSNPLRAALEYARLGYAVLPLQPGEKRPHGRLAPNGLKDASTDPEVLHRWWQAGAQAGVGILPPAEVLVLDFDDPQAWDGLRAEHPELAEAPRQRTPRGGVHVFLKLPQGVIGTLTTTAKKLPGLDLRGLGRAYLAAAPTELPSGAYHWEVPLLPPAELPLAPEGLLLQLLPPPPPPPPEYQAVSFRGLKGDRLSRRLEGLLHWACERVAAAPEGTRHNTLLNAARLMGGYTHLGLAPEQGIRALAEAGVRSGLPLSEAETTARDGLRYGQGAPLELPADEGRGGHSLAPAEALEAHRQAVKLLEGLTPESWPEQRAALLEALQGLDPVSVDLLLKQAASKLGVGVGAMQKALREHARGDEAEPTTARELTRLALEYSELWKDGESTAWATVRVEDHTENWPVRSRAFRLWLTRLYYEERDRPPNAQALQDALATVEARALFAGDEHPVHTRVAHQDGAVWLDLGRPDWQAVRITAEGWSVLPPEVRFRRSKATGALPIPIQGGGEALKDILSPWALEEAPLTLVLAWALGTLSAGPYPVLALSGEQGSGKSTLARTLQRLIDPSGDVGSLPREARDLFIAAKHSHILAFDNVSGLPGWLADGLCKIATGALHRDRELYTNDDEVFLRARRPIILNGITDYLTQQDLVDRSILLHLPPLDHYQPEAELWADFEEAHPRALGSLLDLTALALRDLPRTRTPNVRLADFARWALAAESGYTKVGVFEQAFTEMRADAVRVGLDNEPLYPLLLRLVEGGPFEGSAGELLEQLEALRGGGKKPPEGWPRTPHAVASWLKRTAPALRKVGVQVDPLKRERDKRRWKIAIQKEGGEQTSQMSPMSEARAGRTSEVTFPSPDDVSNVTANVTPPPDDISAPPGDVSNVTPHGQMSPEESRAGRIGDVDDVCDISTPHLSTQGEGEDPGDWEVLIL